jgi:D-tagatose-1,6-bisphosphate aldolase subunit GatZ/KbaZ
MSDILHDIIRRNRAGEVVAIPSVCSAHPEVLRASLLRAEGLDRPIVIEATSNQVNQFGGYTGMTPAAFIGFVRGIADAAKVDRARIVFGGDHLGPQVWRKGPVNPAMAKARTMVSDYVRAGFTKIHLDCSEGCSGELAQLGDEQTAARTAELARACREATDDPGKLLYVIGTEVPPPGGARADEDGDVPATTPASARATLEAHAHAFTAEGLAAELDQVGGLVVQPGVEFSPMKVHHLPMERDPGLRQAIEAWSGLCLEAHSTDYQRPAAYPRLAALGFAFQKVGPALTFAYRQAIYALDQLRHIAGLGDAGTLPGVMEALMLAEPGHWQGHYRGDPAALRMQRHFGLADRIRYYWPQPAAAKAVARLMDDLRRVTLPDPLLWQVFGADVLDRAEALGARFDRDRPGALVAATIQLALDPYYFDPLAAAQTKGRK